MSSHALSSTTSSQDYYFNSDSLSDWNNGAKWPAVNGTNAYPSMMGLLEYLQANFPTTEIVVWAVQWLSVSKTPADPTSFLVETPAGSGVYKRSISLYHANVDVVNYLKSKAVMKEVSEYYNVRFIDVDAQCGITIHNMFDTYYNQKDLHPKTEGYQKWGDTLSKLY